MSVIYRFFTLISSPWKTFDDKKMDRSVHTVFACIYAASLKVIWTQEELAQEHWYSFPMTLLACAVSLISMWALISGYYHWRQCHAAKVVQHLEHVILPDSVHKTRSRYLVSNSCRAIATEVQALRDQIEELENPSEQEEEEENEDELA